MGSDLALLACNSLANAIPNISRAGSPKCAGGVGPGVIGNCICQGIACEGESEYTSTSTNGKFTKITVLYVFCSEVNIFVPHVEQPRHLALKMPIHMLASAVFEGASLLPFVVPLLKILPVLFLVWLLKMYFGGASNTSERLMHSKVIMITVIDIDPAN